MGATNLPSPNRLVSIGGAIVSCLVLCSCMKVAYDVRSLPQPIVMNSTPFVHSPTNRLQFNKVGKYYALSGNVIGVRSMVVGNMTITTAQQGFSDATQFNAAKCLGPGRSRAITDVQISADSMEIYLGVGIAQRMDLEAKGSVYQITNGVQPKAQGYQ